MAVFVFGSGGNGAISSPFKSAFADNTWGQIIQACQENAVPDTWLIGNQKSMTINGVDYLIDIIGKNHDVYSDGTGKAPLTFQIHDLYGTFFPMHSAADNSVGWVGCDMRTTHLPSVLDLMPSEVQTAIREVIKLTLNRSSVLETTNDKLFVLSEQEIFGVVTYSYGVEGVQYEYYIPTGRTIKFRSNTQDSWWQRSIRKGNNGAFCRVNASGNSGSISATTVSPVAFAFCF